MQRQLIFQIGKEELTFGVAPFFFDTIEGLASSENELISYETLNQEGVVFNGTSLNQRDIIINGRIRGNTREEALQYRRKLISICNSKRGLGKLICRYSDGTEYFLKAFANGGVQITEQNVSVIPGNVFEYQITFTAPSPYWLQEEIFSTHFNQVFPRFEFELEINQDDPDSMIFGDVHFNQTTTIDNKGDCPSGFTCIVEGRITDYFILSHLEKEQFIKLELDFKNVDKLVIHSHAGNKKIIIHYKNGTVENGFKYMDLESSFFDLDAGVNEIKFETNSADVDITVEIQHQNLYAGI